MLYAKVLIIGDSLMTWDENLYIGESCKRHAHKTLRKIAKKEMHHGVYLIVRSETPGCMLEIIPSMLLLQPLYPIRDLYVVGIAGFKLESEYLLKQIVQDMYDEGYFHS